MFQSHLECTFTAACACSVVSMCSVRHEPGNVMCDTVIIPYVWWCGNYVTQRTSPEVNSHHGLSGELGSYFVLCARIEPGWARLRRVDCMSSSLSGHKKCLVFPPPGIDISISSATHPTSSLLPGIHTCTTTPPPPHHHPNTPLSVPPYPKSGN